MLPPACVSLSCLAGLSWNLYLLTGGVVVEPAVLPEGEWSKVQWVL